MSKRCRRLRSRGTDAERRLWHMLRNRRLAGFKFRRQHEFGPYILDFFCFEQRLVVEVEGALHFLPEGLEHDRVRDGYLTPPLSQRERGTARPLRKGPASLDALTLLEGRGPSEARGEGCLLPMAVRQDGPGTLTLSASRSSPLPPAGRVSASQRQ